MSEYPDVPLSAVPDDARLLDIREQDEWDRGHAPAAVHIPMSELAERVDELAPLLDEDAPIVVTCRSGGRVQRVLPWLARQGYDAANLAGGMHAWHAAGRPMVAANDAEPFVP